MLGLNLNKVSHLVLASWGHLCDFAESLVCCLSMLFNDLVPGFSGFIVGGGYQFFYCTGVVSW